MSFYKGSFIVAAGLFLLNAARVTAWVPNSHVCRTESSFGIERQSTLRLSATADDAVMSACDLTEDEWDAVKSLYDNGASKDSSEKSLEKTILEALPTMKPSLIMKIRQGQNDKRKEMRELCSALNSVLDSRLTEARDLLGELLDAGEIRKLDALIGKAARSGKLDVAFFQVLNMNLVDAAKEEGSNGDDDDSSAGSSSRYQILQHIYTRCQEEIEKTIPPGVALLNKLMRTEVDSIRINQLNHYLCPQPNIIKTPDGKELKLQGGGQILVPHKEFVQAIGNAVQQIRTVERAGGTSPAVAAGMVESCRQIAKEARVVILQHYGQESNELTGFEEGLEPVFRPTSPDSPFIQGV